MRASSRSDGVVGGHEDDNKAPFIGVVSAAFPESLETAAPFATAGDLEGQNVLVTSGVGAGQLRKIVANTSDTLIIDRDWSPPPRPADCEFDYGQGISLAPGEQAQFVCAGDRCG